MPNDYGQIVKALLEISPWPWDTVGATRIWHTGKDGCAVAMIAEPEVQTSADFAEIDLRSKRWSEGMRNAEFIAASPLWLARAVVDLVEAKASEMSWGTSFTSRRLLEEVLRALSIDPADLAELRRRLDEAKKA